MINGKKYVMSKPKVKLWRQIIKFQEAYKNGELDGEMIIDEMLGVIETAFNNTNVTRDAIEENMDFEELARVVGYIREYVTGVPNMKAAQVPNAVTPARI